MTRLYRKEGRKIKNGKNMASPLNQNSKQEGNFKNTEYVRTEKTQNERATKNPQKNRFLRQKML